MTPHLFCFGLGYVGEHLARALRDQGWRVSGTTRSEHRAYALMRDGINAVLFHDQDRSGEVARLLPQATHIFSTIPPLPGGQDPVYPLLHQTPLSKDITWLGYLSTVGVYGDAQGEVVTEHTPLCPLHPEAKAQAFAEADWRALQTNLGYPCHIFRMSGVYGPERNPLDWIRKHPVPLIQKDGLYCCRIHVDDVAHGLSASMQHPKPGAVYNLSDDEPAPPEIVTAYAYDLLKRETPAIIPYEPDALPTMIRVHYEENRRVSAEYIQKDLDIRWRYPTYREGFAHILDQLEIA